MMTQQLKAVARYKVDRPPSESRRPSDHSTPMPFGMDRQRNFEPDYSIITVSDPDSADKQELARKASQIQIGENNKYPELMERLKNLTVGRKIIINFDTPATAESIRRIVNRNFGQIFKFKRIKSELYIAFHDSGIKP